MKKRGPIEALIVCARVGGDTHFPRLKKRGPIEAPPAGSTSQSSEYFPRLKKRGPIEAYSKKGSRAGAVAFHA